MFLELFPKGPCQLSYVLLFIISMGTLKPVEYPTFLGDPILVLGSHQDDGAPLKMYLDSHLTTYIFKVFDKLLGIGSTM